ncbi:MAG: FtsW/RodA/SpoVE family cell cycle protein [Clostridia bacterium]|nr:FtsW/RodA/SpoVE family cell cycle protein [Clostridia bacterium]
MKKNTQIVRNAVSVPQQRDIISPENYRAVKSGVDTTLLLTVLVLLLFGLVMVFSASYADAQTRYGDSYYFIKRQSGMVVLGLIVMIAVARLPLWIFKRFAPFTYPASVLLLLAVLVVGDDGGGAQRWIALGPIRFQPSEIAKFALILTLAWYYAKFADKAFDRTDIRTANRYGTVYPLCLIGLICVLVLLEKHLSGIIIIGSIGIMIMFVSGIRLKLLGIFSLIGVGGVTAFAFLTDYTKRRIEIWKNPAAFPQDGGWQTLQGMRAIGSGGFFGLGLGNSRQKFSYVSQPQNDFIYTIICEELGYIGALAVIALFWILVWRGFVIAMRSPDRFTQLVAIGISAKIALQVLLNIGVVTNTIPNTGISLPFFSYGGSAIVVQLAEMGTLLAISRYTLEKK